MSMPKCWFCLWSGLALAGLVAVAPPELRAQDATFTLEVVAEDAADEGATQEETADEPTTEAQPTDEAQQVPAEVQGKIIVIGPDGERREFSFGREHQHPAFHVRPPHMFRVGPAGENGEIELGIRHGDPEPEGYVIGLNAVPADATLRTQLGLGEVGLTVQSVMEGGPAATAGLQPHDVLIRIGEQDLTNLVDLVKGVRDSEGEPLKITYLRGGEEQTAELTPVKRTVVVRSARVEDPQQLRAWIEQRIEGPADVEARIPEFHVRSVRPGVVLETRPEPNGRLSELTDQINRLNEQVAELQQAVEELKQTRE